MNADSVFQSEAEVGTLDEEGLAHQHFERAQEVRLAVPWPRQTVRYKPTEQADSADLTTNVAAQRVGAMRVARPLVRSVGLRRSCFVCR